MKKGIILVAGCDRCRRRLNLVYTAQEVAKTRPMTSKPPRPIAMYESLPAPASEWTPENIEPQYYSVLDVRCFAPALIKIFIHPRLGIGVGPPNDIN